MREILFRGKLIDNGEWVQGSLFSEGTRIEIVRGTCNNIGIEGVEVIHETVGQYTGLTDKNGKKIFEWDVLQFNYTGKNHGVEGKATVIFEHGKFGVLWGLHKEFVCLDGFANTTIEVIGNIHDNPELLENP